MLVVLVLAQLFRCGQIEPNSDHFEHRMEGRKGAAMRLRGWIVVCMILLHRDYR